MPRIFPGVFLFLLIFSPELSAAELQTRYAVIHYQDEAEIQNFSWRISGKRLAGAGASELARSRVDEIIERVKTVLDMHPPSFKVSIFLRQNPGGAIAFYSHESRSITAVPNRVTDGVLAHEIAHAIMNSYFSTAPPEKTQEILAQYVDQNLWSEV